MDRFATHIKVTLGALLIGALWFCANAFTSPAPMSAPPFASKVFGFTGTGYSTGVDAPNSTTCGIGTLYDGTTDYGGTSGASFNEDDDDQSDTHTISGAAVNAWEGSGNISLEVTASYAGSTGSGGSCGWCASMHAFLAGYTLNVDYNISGGGTSTYTRQSHPSSTWTWTFTIPAYNGQLASVDFELIALTDCTVGIEVLNPTTCASGDTEFHTDLLMELWRL